MLRKTKLEKFEDKHEEEEIKHKLYQLDLENQNKARLNLDHIKEIVTLLNEKQKEQKEVMDKNGGVLPEGEEELTNLKIRSLFENLYSEMELRDFSNLMVR